MAGVNADESDSNLLLDVNEENSFWAALIMHVPFFFHFLIAACGIVFLLDARFGVFESKDGDSFVEKRISSQKVYQGHPFPIILTPKSPESLESSVAQVKSKKDFILNQAFKHGAVMFRGFNITTAQDFDAFIQAFGLPNFSYEDSLRFCVGVFVFSLTCYVV